MADWKEAKLKSIVEKIIDNRGKNPPIESFGVPVIETSSITGKNKFPDFGLVRKYVSEKTYSEWFRAGHPEKNDLLIATVGNGIGSVSIMTADKGSVAQNIVGFRFNKSMADGNFYYYYLMQAQIQDFLRSLDIGSAQPSLKLPHLLDLDVPLPPLPEQQAIAEVLSSLDDKIDLLHRQNKTLEVITETLFRQWFVEGAEESWDVGTVKDLIEFNPKRTLSKGTIAPYLEMSNVSNEVYHPLDWYDREFASGTKFQNGDTLLARITPCLENGKTAFVDFLENEKVGWGSTEFIVMRTKNGLHPYFSYLLARNTDFRNFAIGSMVGSSGRQRADVENITSYEMQIPPLEVIKRFNGFIEPSLKKMKVNNNQIRSLTRLRDELLPKLMSGEVRLKI